ncbi:MAG: AI-2E family transporter, partial [Terriglobia bacterium]
MLGIDPRVARYTWTIIAVFLIFAIIYKVREIIFLFIVSLLFAYLLWPLLDYLDRRLPGRSRIPALAAVYIVVMALLAFALVEIGTRVLIEANTLVAKLPAFLSQLQQSKTATLQQSHGSAKSMIIIEIQKLLAEHSQNIVSLMPTLAIKAVAAVRIVVFAILVPILSFFLLQDADKMRNFILTIVPEGLRRRQLIGIGADLHTLLAR